MLHVFLYTARYADAAGFGESLQSDGNVYPIAVKVGAFDDDIAKADAYAKRDGLIWRRAVVF